MPISLSAQQISPGKNDLLFYRLEKNGSYTLISDTAGKYANEKDLKSSKEENVEIYFRFKGSDYTKAIYTGEMTKVKLEVGKVQLPHGSGFLISSQLNYNGQWLVGQMHGNGKWKFGVETYDGKFKNGVFNGSGTYSGVNGIYDGEWLNGKKHGKGTLRFFGAELPICEYGSLKAKELETTWENDSIKGEGILTYEETKPKLKIRGDEANYRNNAIKSDSPQEKTLPNMDSEKKIYWNGLKMTGEIDVTFTNGNYFKGFIKNGRVDGKGSLGVYDGVGEYKDFMRGKWNDGKFTGEIQMHYKNNTTYNGRIENDLKVGEGKMTYADGSSFQGLWENNNWGAKGKYTWADGTSYDGELKNSNFHGYGVMRLKNSTWKCNWKDNVPADSGEVEYSSGAKYKGGVSGRINGNTVSYFYQGFGRFFQSFPTSDTMYKSDSTYVGFYSEGLPHGKGKLTRSNTEQQFYEIYDGDWVNGKRQGSGKWEMNLFQRTSNYEGEWKNDIKDGSGVWSTSGEMGNSETCKGTWVNDVMTGYGECTSVMFDMETGNELKSTVKGQYTNSLLQGQGTEISFEGTYSGNFVDGVKSGLGKMIYKDGRIYDGEWKGGLPNGNGIMILANKVVQKGKFENGDYIKPYLGPTTTIGSQVWMASNLNVDRFRNGDVIFQANSINEWEAASKSGKPAWCYYKFNAANGSVFGKLYNWYAVSDPRGLAPRGWHIPSQNEYQQLIDNFGLSYGAIDWHTPAEQALKTKNGWTDGNGDRNGNNSSGFNAQPAGNLNFLGRSNYLESNSWYWSDIGKQTNFWTSTCCIYYDSNASSFTLGYYVCSLSKNNPQGSGYAVRCIKDKDE